MQSVSFEDLTWSIIWCTGERFTRGFHLSYRGGNWLPGYSNRCLWRYFHLVFQMSPWLNLFACSHKQLAHSAGEINMEDTILEECGHCAWSSFSPFSPFRCQCIIPNSTVFASLNLPPWNLYSYCINQRTAGLKCTNPLTYMHMNISQEH